MLEFDEAMRVTTVLQDILDMEGVESRFMIPGEETPYLVMEEDGLPPIFLQIREENEEIRSVILLTEWEKKVKGAAKLPSDGIVTRYQWNPLNQRLQALAALPCAGFAPEEKAFLLFRDLFLNDLRKIR